MRELCSLVETTLAEFNHVNVVTAFRKILLTRCDGVSRVMAEQALQSLEQCSRDNTQKIRDMSRKNS